MNPIQSNPGKPHCNLCILSPEEMKTIDKIFLIFLDMDGVMIKLEDHADKSTLEKLFGKKRDGYTDYQYRVARVYKLYESCVAWLVSFINHIKKSGKKPRIVISSSWGHDGTTEQVCHEMFQSQPSFSSFIIGRTPTKNGDDPEIRRLESQKKESFGKKSKRKYGFDLSSRPKEIEYWLREHRVFHANFAIFDDCRSSMPETFGSRFIEVSPFLEKEHIDKALTILRRPLTYDFSESLRKTWSDSAYPIPKLLGRFRKLKVINLSHNRLPRIEEEIFHLENLRELHLNHNRLTTIPESLSRLAKLTALYLQHNKLRGLPGGIASLMKLKTLNLSHNQITVLSGNISLNTRLHNLNLSNNPIQELPQEIVTLACLQKLDLSQNELRRLPERIEFMKRLQEIDISGNHFPADEVVIFPADRKRLIPFQSIYSLRDKIPEESNCAYLKYSVRAVSEKQDAILGETLDLTGLPWLDALERIEERETLLRDKILCDFCQALKRVRGTYLGDKFVKTDCPVEIDDFPSDKSASAWRSWLKKWAPAFKKLRMPHSRLNYIPKEIAWFVNLESLNLSINRLAKLPPGISALKHLKELDIGSNQFKTLLRALSRLTQLEKLNISGNPFQDSYLEVEKLPSDFPNLKSLNIARIGLYELPDNFYLLHHLEELCLVPHPLNFGILGCVKAPQLNDRK